MAIVFDSSGFGTGNNITTISWTHNIVSNTNGILVAVIGNPGTANVTNLAYAGTNLTKVIAGTETPTLLDNQAWYLLNPPTGLGTFNGTYSASNFNLCAVSMAYTGVNIATPVAGSVVAFGTLATSGSITRTITAGNFFVGGAYITISPGTTVIGNERGTANRSPGPDEQIGADATTGTLRWTSAVNTVYSMVAIELNAAAAVVSTTTPMLNLLGVGN